MRAQGAGNPRSAFATRCEVSGGSEKKSGRPIARNHRTRRVAIVPNHAIMPGMSTDPATPGETAASPADPSRDLVSRLVEASELRGDFVLSSGRRSSVYFDKFLFLTRPGLLRELAHEVAGLVPAGVDHLAAPEGAATLLVAAVSLETGLPVAVVRKEPKAYGTRSQIEGHAPRGARACLIEDVSTTGHQVQRAAVALTDAGVTVERIVLAIDRGGADHLRGSGYDVAAVAVLRPQDGG